MDHSKIPQQEDHKSKSQLKRESHALQKLGEALVALSPEQLAKINIPENLLTAIKQAQQIRSHEAKRRQMQYIGKIMRNINVDEIEQALNEIAQQHSAASYHFQLIEEWRERLINNEKAALTEFVKNYKQVDTQQLRHFIQQACRERSQAHPKGAARALFRFLREVIEMHEQDQP